MWTTHVDKKVLNLIEGGDSILDFGCGDGGYSRNINKKYKSIHLFDYPEMVKDIPSEIAGINNVSVFSDWDDVKNNKYDQILATLVFQHIHPADLDTYLSDMSQMTTKLIVKSRLDFNPYISKELFFKNYFVLPYLEKYFDLVHREDDKDKESFIGVFSSKNKGF